MNTGACILDAFGHRQTISAFLTYRGTASKNRDLMWKSGFFWGEILQQPRPTVRIFLIVETQAVDCKGGLLFSFFLPSHEASGSRRAFNICYTVLKIYCKVRSGKIISFIKYSHFASNL
jgi:hypothetical protein